MMDDYVSYSLYKHIIMGIINPDTPAPLVRVAMLEPQFGVYDVPIHVFREETFLGFDGSSNIRTSSWYLPVYRNGIWEGGDSLFLGVDANKRAFYFNIEGKIVEKYDRNSADDLHWCGMRTINVLDKDTSTLKLILANSKGNEITPSYSVGEYHVMTLAPIYKHRICNDYLNIVGDFCHTHTMRYKLGGMDVRFSNGRHIGDICMQLRYVPSSSEPFRIPSFVNVLDRDTFQCKEPPVEIIADNCRYMIVQQGAFATSFFRKIRIASAIWLAPGWGIDALLDDVDIRTASFILRKSMEDNMHIANRLSILYANEYAPLIKSQPDTECAWLDAQIMHNGVVLLDAFPHGVVHFTDYYTQKPCDAFLPEHVANYARAHFKTAGSHFNVCDAHIKDTIWQLPEGVFDIKKVV